MAYQSACATGTYFTARHKWTRKAAGPSDAEKTSMTATSTEADRLCNNKAKKNSRRFTTTPTDCDPASGIGPLRKDVSVPDLRRLRGRQSSLRLSKCGRNLGPRSRVS